MTMTVKLTPDLEAQLRQRASRSGRSASEVMRAALIAYLAQDEKAPVRSPYELGADLFGRYTGAPKLATERKQELARIWADKHARRR